MRQLHSLLFLMACTILLAGCSQEDSAPHTPAVEAADSNIKEYSLAVLPLHNPTRLFEVFQPLINYLNARTPNATFKLEASRDFASFNTKLKTQAAPFAIANPYQVTMAIDSGYNVFAKMGDDFNFRGTILVRKDSNIKTPQDLKGKIMSFPAPSALAATMLPQYFLHQHGLDINKDITNKYVGSLESAIMSVYVGNSTAAGGWQISWENLAKQNPELKEKIKVMWQTQSLPHIGVVARPDVPDKLVKHVQKLLVDLDKAPEGKKILQPMRLSKYEVATNQTYDVVRDFVREFYKTVRPPTTQP